MSALATIERAVGDGRPTRKPSEAERIATKVNDLWIRYLEKIVESNAAYEHVETATAAMPWWAKPGPSHLYEGGRIDGPLVGWPAYQGVSPPKNGSCGAWKVIREGLHDIRRQRDLMISIYGDFGVPRRNILKGYRNRVRKWVALQRAYKAEQAKVGLPAFRQRSEELSEQRYDLHCQIRDMRGRDPHVVVGRLLLASVAEAYAPDTVNSACWHFRELIEDFRSEVGGQVALVADEFLAALDSDDCLVRDLSFWG